MLIGHGCFGEHLHRIDRENSPRITAKRAWTPRDTLWRIVAAWEAQIALLSLKV